MSREAGTEEKSQRLVMSRGAEAERSHRLVMFREAGAEESHRLGMSRRAGAGGGGIPQGYPATRTVTLGYPHRTHPGYTAVLHHQHSMYAGPRAVYGSGALGSNLPVQPGQRTF